MSELYSHRQVVGWAAVLACFAIACARQQGGGVVSSEQATTAGGSSVVEAQPASKELDSLREQLRVERSFAAFLDGLRGSRMEALPWDSAAWGRVDDLYRSYRAAVNEAAAVVVPDPDGNAGGDPAGRGAEALRQRLAALREQRLALSGAVAEQVIGLDPAKQEGLLDEGFILEMIRTGRESYSLEGGGESPTERQAVVLSAMRELDPQARDEVSFGWFISALWLDGPGVFVPGYIEKWDGPSDLVSDYTSTASVYPGQLWFYLQPKGLRQAPKKMQAILDSCERELPILRQQRFAVSEAILKQVFGIIDPALLHEVATGEPLAK